MATTLTVTSRRSPGRLHLFAKVAEPLFVILLYLPFIGLVLSGVITFVAWQQVEDLHYARLDLDLLYGHPHFFRYLVARPGLLLSDVTGPVGFSFYVANFAAASIFLMYLMLRRQHWLLIVLACASIFLVQLFMNGRGAISWFGWMAILWLIFEPDRLRWYIRMPILFFALLCTSVSSGTFTVAYLAVIGFYLHRLRKDGFFTVAVTIGALLYMYYGLFIEGLARNMSYYTLGTRHPLINMLRHGFGEIVLNNPVLFVLAVITLFLVIGAIVLALRVKPQMREILVLALPLAGGTFGYTTLSMLLPSVIVVISRRAAGLIKSGA